MKIAHPYADGRGWNFNNVDVLLRVFYQGDGWQAWIKRPEVPVFYDYGSQQESGYGSVEHILGDR
jgi:hypothetical protein